MHRRIAQKTFHTVRLCARSSKIDPAKSGLYVRVPSRKMLTATLGEGIRSLFITSRLSTVVARAIVTHSSGLRHLSFEHVVKEAYPTKKLCAIIDARGTALESLCLSKFDADELLIAAISSNCQRLRRISLLHPEEKTAGFSLEPLWKSIGGSLENLEVGCMGG